MNVLIVLTSHDKLGDSGENTGFWLEEFAAPYYALKDAGAEITLASPKGGQPPIDPKSSMPENSTEATRRFFADSVVQTALANTLPLADISAENFDALFYPGGHGPLWDLPDNSASIALITAFIEDNKPVGAVCHAPVALVNVRKSNGEFLVKGKRVTGFSNSEEETIGLVSTVPFLLEDKLKERGGIYSKATNWFPYIQVDDKLVTGQNPASSILVAEELLNMLGVSKRKKAVLELKTPYAFGRTVNMPYAETEQKVREELLKEGFSILTEINVRKKFAEKLNKDFRNYMILGACKPHMAYEALSLEINIGTLLPCNVIVYSMDDDSTGVMAMDPISALAMIGNPKIDGIAHKIAEMLQRVISSL